MRPNDYIVISSLFFFFKWEECGKTASPVGTLFEGLRACKACIHSGVVIPIQPFPHVRCYTNRFLCIVPFKALNHPLGRGSHLLHRGDWASVLDVLLAQAWC